MSPLNSGDVSRNVEPFAINLGWDKVLHDAGYLITSLGKHGPSGVAAVLLTPAGEYGSVVVSQADWDGEEWLHASLALPRMPSYDEVALLHRAVFGRRRYAFQVFAPVSSHVNIHATALHLWGRADGRNVLPDFGAHGTI